MNRRQLVKTLGAGLAATTLSKTTILAGQFPAREKSKKLLLRVAHITDVHIRPEHNAPERFRKCLEEIKKQKVDFFINGGDSIYAADYNNITRERVTEQWNIWKDCIAGLKDYEMHSVLGNHDMWWAAPDKTDPMYGKDFVVKQLGTPGRYYSFDKKGWHFILLDSNNGKAGSLDAEQRAWLEQDLAGLPKDTPVICLSHYPIMGVCTILEGGNHTDSRYISDLFYKHRDKKIVALSGHIHLLDTAWYNGVQYFCNGAMSGFWWEDGDKDSAGKYFYKQTPPGYAILDLYADGTVVNKYHAHAY